MVNGSNNIPGFQPTPKTEAVRPLQKKPEFKPAPKAEVSPQRDQVTLSPRAKEVSQAKAKVASLPELRQDRVQEAKSKIIKSGDNAGVNAKIAEKLLTEN